MATSRRPNANGLNLTKVGIKRDGRGAVVVDDRMRTTRPGVYAAGDVTGRDQFVYMAAYGAKLAAKNVLNGDTLVHDNGAMPWVVFSDPQVAGVRITEARACAAGHRVKTSVAPHDKVPRALAARDTRGLIKLMADAGTDAVLGGQILGPEGADMALKARTSTQALGETIFP